MRYKEAFDSFRPVTFKLNDGTSGRTHIGFIAQEIKEACDKANITTQEFAPVVIKSIDSENSTWGLRYHEFIALNTWQIQKLKTRVNELEREIKEIK